MKKLFYLINLCIFVMLQAGCAAVLPSSKQTVESPWRSFEDAKESFDKIIPQQTSLAELKALGFDPFQDSNVKLINYLDLIQRFIPNESIRQEDLPAGVQTCLKAQGACYGYLIQPEVVNKKRYGNAFLDLLDFRRQTMISGWNVDALIVLQDELVVYKLWSGEPKILRYEDEKNPLGPFQDIGKLFKFDGGF